MNPYLRATPDLTTPGDLRGAVRDPKDDNILEAALLAGARYLVTGDKDLLFVESSSNCMILTPRAYLQLVSPLQALASIA